ncbi:LacI family DNA-binding transcriptional regulator [Salibaculum sp.]|uniref:LacI family DNA-binding transcriptional regulator n=1 Tax=Salibaculum sp. TaxID=2855480 RepID=UPI002B47ECB3|nr:substrate-binding domain-containing protein [Salibaculum sp.]HKL69958.1 substrate-binding domain-containing protein [Salibaculum sp.]
MNLKELSAKLNLSPTTVSRALNGYPEVKEETRRRVLDAASRYDYSPNARAQGLATGRSQAIGHVIPLSTKHEMVNPIFGDFIAGAGETYSSHGYEMLISVVEDDRADDAYRSLKRRGVVDGVIVHGPRMEDSRIPMLQELGLPFVVHGRASGLAQDYSWLDVNNRRAFQRATDFLLDLGHRRIALLNGLETMDFAARRRAGFEAALTARGLNPDPGLEVSGEMTEAMGHGSALALLDRPMPPTAFVVSSMISAMGVRRALEDRGLRMGQDVSVVTHDDALSYFTSGADVPLFTSTRSSVREAGRQVAQMLIDRIDTPDAPPRQVLLEAELTVGRSTGPAPKQ